MDVFKLRNELIDNYANFSSSFSSPRAEDIQTYLRELRDQGRFWPPALIQMNPSFRQGESLSELVQSGFLEPEILKIFEKPSIPFYLYSHQEEAVRLAHARKPYVLTTGTGSGKSLSFFIPIINDIIRQRRLGRNRRGITAIVVYPMNALCNSQIEELEKYLKSSPVNIAFERYTGQESQEKRDYLAKNPPDILLTNFVMLEYLMTRQEYCDIQTRKNAEGLRFLVLDELHTYRGRQGSDVALLVRRLRERWGEDILCIGTSATMSNTGSRDDRAKTVADFATLLFGVTIDPKSVIQEKLVRITDLCENPSPHLNQVVERFHSTPSQLDFNELKSCPLAAWVEVNLGIQLDPDTNDTYSRISKPLDLSTAAKKLSEVTKFDEAFCERSLNHFLLKAHEVEIDETKRKPFAFKLHQFVSGAGNLYSTLEPEGKREFTVNGQQFLPGNREKRLFNICFCRECGQEYFPVWTRKKNDQIHEISPRELRDRKDETDDELSSGFIYLDPEKQFNPDDLNNYPEDWLDDSSENQSLKYHYRKRKPVPIHLDTNGKINSSKGVHAWFLATPFSLCLNPHCKAELSGRGSDIMRLASLSGEGRSSATTMLTLSLTSQLRNSDSGLNKKAQKVLAFTDNRQDASLQAGHFNDFVHWLRLRTALLSVLDDLQNSGETLDENNLGPLVTTKLALDPEEYAQNPDARGQAAERCQKTLRDYITWRLFQDLKKSVRLSNPNLERLGLLKINYKALDECCEDNNLWAKDVGPWTKMDPANRLKFAKSLLEYLRGNLCINSQFLDADFQYKLKSNCSSHLKSPWAMTEESCFETKKMVIGSRPNNTQLDSNVIWCSSQSQWGRQLIRNVGSEWFKGNSKEETKAKFKKALEQMLEVLYVYDFVRPSSLSKSSETTRAYQLNGETMCWLSGDSSDRGRDTYFREIYAKTAQNHNKNSRVLKGVQAREHTAQVGDEERESRENDFRSGTLPVLFCSPTMELGVDISELNVVLLRNVPPTPANYAQRSGRAGRSGQPALVITYCSSQSPHDQYFFDQPELMVSGVVNPPPLDLTNEDLVRSHLQAMWLEETGTKLKSSLEHVIKLEDDVELPLEETIKQGLSQQTARDRAMKRARSLIQMLIKDPHQNDLDQAENIIRQALNSFEDALKRWREMYRSLCQLFDEMTKQSNNPRIEKKLRDDCNRRAQDARREIELLKEGKQDFYVYRYLASEGFLPGYNFPRLPLLAYIPAKRQNEREGTYLTRPRFIGLSEFGPRSLIYHEGSRYIVRRVHLPRESIGDSPGILSNSVTARFCVDCGYVHSDNTLQLDCCVHCGSTLSRATPLEKLLKIERVVTQRYESITSDEEERQRQGYETVIGWQQSTEKMTGSLSKDDNELALIHYIPATRIWKVNLGWRRRKNQNTFGFNLNTSTGQWCKDEQSPEEEEDLETPNAKKVQRVIPFVQDTKNALILEPKDIVEIPGAFKSLQYSLKRAIEILYSLESSELATECLPNNDSPERIIYYEASEGGAGVLKQLVSNTNEMAKLAKKALELCHFNSKSGEFTSLEDLIDDQSNQCEAGCYRCLLSYANQPDHSKIDRRNPDFLNYLINLSHSNFEKKFSDESGTETHFEQLQRHCQTDLEKAWLSFIKEHGFKLPDKAQQLYQNYSARPDFSYEKHHAFIYIDGPIHDSAKKLIQDEQETQDLEEHGLTVIRFPAKKRPEWHAICVKYPSIFGPSKQEQSR